MGRVRIYWATCERLCNVTRMRGAILSKPESVVSCIKPIGVLGQSLRLKGRSACGATAKPHVAVSFGPMSTCLRTHRTQPQRLTSTEQQAGPGKDAEVLPAAALDGCA